MRNYFIILLFLYLPFTAFGQLYTPSDNYVHSSLSVNPAFAGSQDALSTTLQYRSNWNDFNGSPKTLTLSLHSPLNVERIGLGLVFMNDRIGISNENCFIGNYAYRTDLGYGKLSFGLGFGITVQNNDWDKLMAHDENDEQLASKSSTGIMPDFSIGIFYVTRKYFIGFSLPSFLSHEYNAESEKYTTKNDFSRYNYFFNSGYIFYLNTNIKFFPSLLMKYQKGNTMQFDLLSQVILKDRVWLGAAYRSKNVLVAMLRCQVNNQMNVAYSYDFAIGKNGNYKNNSHEIMIGYTFNYKVEVSGPRQF